MNSTTVCYIGIAFVVLFFLMNFIFGIFAKDDKKCSKQFVSLQRRTPMPGTFHIDQTCESALIRLNDALCSFERETSREYTLILIPHESEEQIIVSENGKPLPKDALTSPEEALKFAMRKRRREI